MSEELMTCPRCEGTGEVYVEELQELMTCPRCEGTGEVYVEELREHSKEPWALTDDYYDIISPESGLLGSVNEFTEANKIRIVACVNALAGLNPDKVKGLVKAVKAYIDLDGDDPLVVEAFQSMVDALAEVKA